MYIINYLLFLKARLTNSFGGEITSIYRSEYYELIFVLRYLASRYRGNNNIRGNNQIPKSINPQS